MSRRKGFTRDQRQEYDRLSRLGLYDKDIAKSFGWSPATLSRTKRGLTRASRLSVERFNRPAEMTRDRRTGTLVSSDVTKITYEELQMLADTGRAPRTRKLALKAIDNIDDMGLTISELQNMTFDRPVFWRMYKGQRVKLLLGRSKGDVMQESVRRQLRGKDINLDDAEYLDFGGYGGVRV